MATKQLYRVQTYRPSYKQVSDLTSDTVYSYTAGSGKYLVAPGDIIEAGGFRYSAVASDATDYDIESANGVRLVKVADSDARGGLAVAQSASGSTDISDGLTMARARAAALSLDGTSYSSGADIDIKTGDKIRGGGATLTFTAGNRFLNLHSDSATQRAYELQDGQPNVWRIEEAQAGATCVEIHSSSAGAGSNFSVGDKITISAGISPSDADDPLWEFSRAYRVTRVDGDFIHFDGDLPCSLRDGPFAPGSAADQAVAYADATAYSVGDFVLAGEAGDAPGGLDETACFRRITNGTSSGATLADDGLGTNWLRVCKAQRDELGTRDGRCVIQIWDDDDLVSDVEISDLNITHSIGSAVITPIQSRSCLDVTIEDFTASGDILLMMGASEHANRVVYERPHVAAEPTDRCNAISIYAAHLECRNGFAQGGVDASSGTAYPAVFIETGGTLVCDNMVIKHSSDALGSPTNHWGLFADGGHLRLKNRGTWGPFVHPFRFQTPVDEHWDWDNLRPMFSVEAEGWHIIAAGRGMRTGMERYPGLNIWPGNTITVFDTGIPGVATQTYRGTRVARVSKTFTMTNNKLIVTDDEFDLTPQEGRFAPARGPAVLLGLEVYWDSPDASADDIEVRVKVIEADGSTERWIAASNSTNSVVTLTKEDGDVVKGFYAFNGTGNRCIGTGERLVYQYGSGANAASGGDVTVTAVLLVGEDVEEVTT